MIVNHGNQRGGGIDTLILTGADTSISLSDIIETEVIDISGNGANTLFITSDDVINANVTGDIYVRGDADDTVDLGNVGADLTEGAGAEAWAMTETSTVDGVNYDVYVFNNNPDTQVYIDTNIGNVI